MCVECVSVCGVCFVIGSAVHQKAITSNEAAAFKRLLFARSAFRESQTMCKLYNVF